MYKYILQSVEGVQFMGITAFLIFFGVFCAALFRVWRGRQSDFEALARLPLEEEKNGKELLAN